jgi:hypothetical protein
MEGCEMDTQIEAPDFEIVGRLEDLAFGGGSDPEDGFNGWNPQGTSPICNCACQIAP